MNQIKPTFRKGMIAAGILLCVPTIYGATPNNPSASNVTNIPGSVSDDNVSDRSLSVTQQAAIQTEAIRTYKDDIRDNLPPLAQHAAIEFYKAMESDFTAFSQNNNTSIKAWGEFLRHVIFQREMGISIGFLGSVVEMNTVLRAILDVNCVSTSESKQIASLFKALENSCTAEEASYLDLSDFLDALKISPNYANIKKNNPYGLFLDGFLELIQGIQSNNNDQKENGNYKLILSAYGLNKKAFLILNNFVNSTININELKNLELIKNDLTILNDIKLLESMIKNQIFLSPQSIPYFNRLSADQQKHWTKTFDHFFKSVCDLTYNSLDNKTYYNECENALRTHFMAKQTLAAPYQSNFWKLDIIFPFLTAIVGGTLTSTTLKDETLPKVVQLTGAILMFLAGSHNLLRALYMWWQSMHVPAYSQNQVMLTALYLTYTNKYTSVTAGALTQEFIDYLKDKSFKDKTLSQFALTFREEK